MKIGGIKVMKKIISVITGTGLLLSATGYVYAADIPLTIPTPSNLKITNIGALLSGAIGFILVIAALAAFIFLIWGGIQWITSGGDKSSVEAARQRILAAIIGLFVVFAAWALMAIIGQFFGFDIGNLSLPKGYQ
jgi:hypothetical protein